MTLAPEVELLNVITEELYLQVKGEVLRPEYFGEEPF
jgi:hypothetical protein